jgi:diguanylate cyclase (GGDEF)-like protein
LDVDSVSRHHAIIEWTGNGHRLIDKGSTNGTFVNNQRIQECSLSDGDHIQIGKALLKYLAGGNIEAAYHKEFAHLMHHDGLTGARTKASFEQALREALVPKPDTKACSLVVFDLDHFKAVNDTHGHTAGDAVLRQAAAAAATAIGEAHVFGRVGGEEFAVLMESTSLGEAAALAEQVRGALEGASVAFENNHIPVTASFGVAEHTPGAAESAEDFYSRADQLLYAAKSAGRNRVCAA